jgi:hypothetical protein
MSTVENRFLLYDARICQLEKRVHQLSKNLEGGTPVHYDRLITHSVLALQVARFRETYEPVRTDQLKEESQLRFGDKRYVIALQTYLEAEHPDLLLGSMKAPGQNVASKTWPWLMRSTR